MDFLKKIFLPVSPAWIILGHVYVINWRGTLSRHNSHLTWNKRSDIKCCWEEGVVVSLILWNARKHIWNRHQKRAFWQHTRGSQHLNKLNILVYDQKRVRRVPIFPPRFVWYVPNSHMASWNLQTLSSSVLLNHIIHSMTMCNL